MNSEKPLRIPKWLRVKLPSGRGYGSTCRTVRDMGLGTVCQSARCPNVFECFSRKVATFLIMGPVCTRACSFCNISSASPAPLDPDEPLRLSRAVAQLELRHVVVTSVTRDDLPDGGAGHFAAVIERLRSDHSDLTCEVLVPDFQGDVSALETVLAAGPDVFNHNIETVARVFPKVRPLADYAGSLELLRRAREWGGMLVKSGLMVGLGENDEEVRSTIEDLAAAGCDIVTVGQYMRPSLKHAPVRRYVHPDVFDEYAAHGRAAGVRHMFSAPLVRSSYNAELFVTPREDRS